jgi:membrane dipeptidase
MKKSKIGAQFWIAQVPCNDRNPVDNTINQIKIIHDFNKNYSNTFKLALTVQDIENNFQINKISSLIGIEGGHSINSSITILKNFYNMGVRYLSLTHSCNTPWCDGWDDVPRFGINQLGVIKIFFKN